MHKWKVIGCVIRVTNAALLCAFYYFKNFNRFCVKAIIASVIFLFLEIQILNILGLAFHILQQQ